MEFGFPLRGMAEQLMVEIDRCLAQYSILVEEQRRLQRERDRRQAELEERALRHHEELRVRSVLGRWRGLVGLLLAYALRY